MPKLANRSGAMPKVEPPPPEPTPEPTPEVEKISIAESTADAFDKEPKIAEKIEDREEMIEEDVIPQTQTEPIDIPKQKKQKKPCSDKLKAHLARCREISLAKRRSNKNTTPKTVATRTPKPTPTPTPTQPSQSSIDYDRIINGVSNSLYSRFGLDEPQYQPPRQTSFHEPRVVHQPPRQSQEEMLKEYEKKIREDERNRLKAERQAELDRTFKSKGMNVLKNGMPTHHRNTNMYNNNTNPYAGAFGRRH